MEIGSCAGQVIGADLAAKMDALHAIGFDFIEPAWKEDDLPLLGETFGAELRKLGARTGCPVRSAILGTFPDIGKRLRTIESRAAERDAIMRACETLAAAGGDVLLLPNWAGENAPDYDGLYTAFLREVGEQAARLNVRLGIEHIPSSKYRNTAVQVYDLAVAVDLANVGVYFDIANGLYIGDDAVESARTIAARVVQFHVKGFPRGGRPLEAMPLQTVREILVSAGFRGRVATEIDPVGEASEQTNAHLTAALATLRTNGY